MLTFRQFLSEARESHIGWLWSKGKPVTADPEHTHEDIAADAFATSTEEALQDGKVRFIHTHEPHQGYYAGYEFHDSPQTRKLVDRHLGRSGGFRNINFDIRGKTGMKSHSFRSIEDARKHLAV